MRQARGKIYAQHTNERRYFWGTNQPFSLRAKTFELTPNVAGAGETIKGPGSIQPTNTERTMQSTQTIEDEITERWHVVLGGCGDLAGVMSGDQPVAMLGRAKALNPRHVAMIIETPELLRLIQEALDDGGCELIWQVKAEDVLQRIAEFRMPAETDGR